MSTISKSERDVVLHLQKLWDNSTLTSSEWNRCREDLKWWAYQQVMNHIVSSLGGNSDPSMYEIEGTVD